MALSSFAAPNVSWDGRHLQRCIAHRHKQQRRKAMKYRRRAQRRRLHIYLRQLLLLWR